MWNGYGHNFAKFKSMIEGISGDPALEAGLFGYLGERPQARLGHQHGNDLQHLSILHHAQQRVRLLGHRGGPSIALPQPRPGITHLPRRQPTFAL
jgi:hypothetical protein